MSVNYPSMVLTNRTNEMLNYVGIDAGSKGSCLVAFFLLCLGIIPGLLYLYFSNRAPATHQLTVSLDGSGNLNPSGNSEGLRIYNAYLRHIQIPSGRMPSSHKMNPSDDGWKWLFWILMLVLLITAVSTSQQQHASWSSFLMVVVVVILFGIPLQRMALDAGFGEDSWMAWVPIADLFLLLKLAGRPMWWFILFLIPIVNIVVIIMVGMDMCEKYGFNRLYGLLIIISPLNLILMYYLAFSGSKPPAPIASPRPRAQ
jgi:uncharacterized membrane protein YhaH (DUF805 family)